IVASGGGFVESDIRLWDLANGAEIGRLQGHRSWVSHLVFWPDGKTLASASSDQTIRLWDVRKQQPLRTLRGHQLEVFRLALLRDNKTLLSGCKDGSVCVWDTAANSTHGDRVILPGQFAGWHFTPDNRSVLTCDKDGQVTRWFDYDLQEPGSTTVFNLRT